MIIEIFDAFLVRIIKLFHRNFIVTIFVSVLIVLVRRKYKLSDIKNELNFIWNDIKKSHRYRNAGHIRIDKSRFGFYRKYHQRKICGRLLLHFRSIHLKRQQDYRFGIN